jgi:hypothetical protein
MTPVARPSGYLQQEPHLPSVHLAQAEQVLLQHFPQTPSAAVAAASPSPAMTASRAPALISVFMVCCPLLRAGIIPVLNVIHRRGQNPPNFFRSHEIAGFTDARDFHGHRMHKD